MAWLALAAPPAAAQIVRLDGARAPAPGVLDVYRRVRALPGELTARAGLVPDVGAEDPFEDWGAAAGYRGVLLAVLPERKFRSMVAGRTFHYELCKQLDKDASEARRSETEGIVDIIPGVGHALLSLQMKRPGSFVVLVANCGNLSGFQLRGQVSFGGTGGMCTSLDVRKGVFYITLAVLYALFAVGWMALSGRSTLSHARRSILLVNMLAVPECVLMWAFFRRCKYHGFFNGLFHVAAVGLSLWRVSILFRLAILGPAPAPDKVKRVHAGAALHCLLALHAALEFQFRAVLRERAVGAAAFREVVASAWPAAATFAALLLWSACAAWRRWRGSRGEAAGAEAAAALRVLLLVTLAAPFVLAVRVLDPIVDRTAPGLWRHHVWVSEAPPQLLAAAAFWAAALAAPPRAPPAYAYARAAGAEIESQPIGAPAADMANIDLEELSR